MSNRGGSVSNGVCCLPPSLARRARYFLMPLCLRRLCESSLLFFWPTRRFSRIGITQLTRIPVYRRLTGGQMLGSNWFEWRLIHEGMLFKAVACNDDELTHCNYLRRGRRTHFFSLFVLCEVCCQVTQLVKLGVITSQSWPVLSCKTTNTLDLQRWLCVIVALSLQRCHRLLLSHSTIASNTTAATNQPFNQFNSSQHNQQP